MAAAVPATWPSLTEGLSSLLDALQLYRDTFHATHERTQWPQRTALITTRAQQLVDDNRIASSDAAAQLSNELFAGCVWSVVASVDVAVVARALAHLQKCVAMQPGCACAWQAIGDCHTADKQYAQAISAYRTALKHNRLARTLRALSPIIRCQQFTESKHRFDSMKESIALAREAATLEDDHVENWYVLGNGNISYFFATAQHDSNYLNAALDAFHRATLCPRGLRSAELFYNYGEALRFGQAYEPAVNNYKLAHLADPTLAEAEHRRDRLTEFVLCVQGAVNKKGSMRGKRLRDAIAQLSVMHDTPTNSMWGGQMKSPAFPIDLRQFEYDTVTERKDGRQLLPLHITAMCMNEEIVPFTCVAIDMHNECTAVCVYNCSTDFALTVGTTIVVDTNKAVRKRITLPTDNSSPTIDYSCIRICSPDALIVNGHRLTAQKRALSTLATNIAAE